MSEVKLTYSKSMLKLMNGDFLNGKTCGFIAGEIFKESFGATGLVRTHFTKGQSKWPALNPKTSRGKQDKRKFVNSGTTLKAISSSVNHGKVATWGSASDWSSKGKRKKKYASGGIFASIHGDKNGFTLVAGFNGKLRHSGGFNKVRKQLAADRGVNFNELKGKALREAINKAVKVGEVQGRINLQIKKPKKYAVAKARKKGTNNNLAYANIVQAGGGYNKAKKTPRPLMPYDNSDVSRIQSAIERAVQKIFKKLENS